VALHSRQFPADTAARSGPSNLDRRSRQAHLDRNRRSRVRIARAVA